MKKFKFSERPEFRIINWFCASQIFYNIKSIEELDFVDMGNESFEVYLSNGQYYLTI